MTSRNDTKGNIGEDGMLMPSTPMREEIARLSFEGKHYKEIAGIVGCHPDTARKALKEDDVQAHILRLKIQTGEGINRLKVRDWREFAPAVQQFYEFIMQRAMQEPEYIRNPVGKDDDGTILYESIANPVAMHFHKLAAQIAPRVEDRVWGKTPQKIEVDKLPTAERLGDLTDAQLDYYRRQILQGIDKNMAFAEAMRIEDADYEFEPFAGFIKDAEILMIEGEVES
ncbi:MAG: hypothetical protein AMS18_00205 [Gemmatimonas sp. SG8_17]|nr:MAG: hypothetical protein AMS18_00205 [Gemmatimonas sp. SG8_17]